MDKQITAVVFSFFESITKDIVTRLFERGFADKIIVVSKESTGDFKNITSLRSDYPFSADTISKIIKLTKTPYILFINGKTKIEFFESTISSFLSGLDETNASWIYSDFNEKQVKDFIPHPLIDYQIGSIRDDFDFGNCFLVKADFIKDFLTDSTSIKNNFIYSGLYDLRLHISRKHPVIRISKPLYSVAKLTEADSSGKMFEYVDPKNREVQIEMEKVATEHLKWINAFCYKSESQF
ncbi:MAG: hypothetical protein P8X47_09805 [Ignavibacteriaceae bacterium]